MKQQFNVFVQTLSSFLASSDLRIKKTFDDNPILWALVNIVARGRWWLVNVFAYRTVLMDILHVIHTCDLD